MFCLVILLFIVDFTFKYQHIKDNRIVLSLKTEINKGTCKKNVSNYLLEHPVAYLKNALLLITGTIQVFTGFLLRDMSIIGWIPSIWFTVVLSLSGSFVLLLGGYQVCKTISKPERFDILIDKSIQRVIKDRN